MPPEARKTSRRSTRPEQTSTFLFFANQVKRQVESHLQRRLTRELESLTNLGPEVHAACAAATEVCSRGGKRVRAALVVAGAECIGPPPNTTVLTEIGAAIELLHAYFLIHDDWMDGDLVRRGGPSAHALLRTRFGASSGDAAAILAGDWSATVANQWMTHLKLPDTILGAVLTAFFQMQRAAIYGQLRDSLSQGQGIERTYELKTASYTVEGPLTIGALVSGAKPSTVRSLRSFALPLGVAFQLRDDLIGLFSSEAETGKPFGSDLKAGKFTFIARDAMKHARGAERRQLEAVFGNPRATERALRNAVHVIESVGARSRTEKKIAQLVRAANARLAEAPVRTQGRELLISASNALALRST